MKHKEFGLVIILTLVHVSASGAVHLRPNPLPDQLWDPPLPAYWQHSRGSRRRQWGRPLRYDPQNREQMRCPESDDPSDSGSADAPAYPPFPGAPALLYLKKGQNGTRIEKCPEWLMESGMLPNNSTGKKRPGLHECNPGLFLLTKRKNESPANDVPGESKAAKVAA